MDMTPNYDTIPLKERLELQNILIETMLGEVYLQNTETIKHVTAFQWANKYIKKVSSIIDNIENKEIRDLILNHQYKEAGELIIPILKEEVDLAA